MQGISRGTRAIMAREKLRSVTSLTFAGSLRRVAEEASVAGTLEAARDISALCVRATGSRLAFIFVTTLRSDGLEAITAETLTLHTLGVVYTVEIRMTQDADAGLQRMRSSGF